MAKKMAESKLEEAIQSSEPKKAPDESIVPDKSIIAPMRAAPALPPNTGLPNVTKI